MEGRLSVGVGYDTQQRAVALAEVKEVTKCRDRHKRIVASSVFTSCYMHSVFKPKLMEGRLSVGVGYDTQQRAVALAEVKEVTKCRDRHKRIVASSVFTSCYMHSVFKITNIEQHIMPTL
ncbi:hypothetical protein MSG28_012660 [Choristoneura fumiferana]|uniref:Uncharacterized protein n=1 Tax=Choristoneura fumiferana TaxID=7141 RepID=A0ACC0JHI8_CHOFU|nr:hypothetical protein MSG28_012660 [Choristoneura fumiferana]